MKETVLNLLGALLASPVLGETPKRWVPDHCLEFSGSAKAEDAEERWNAAYGRGFRSIGLGAYDVAEVEMCEALINSKYFKETQVMVMCNTQGASGAVQQLVP